LLSRSSQLCISIDRMHSYATTYRGEGITLILDVSIRVADELVKHGVGSAGVGTESFENVWQRLKSVNPAGGFDVELKLENADCVFGEEDALQSLSWDAFVVQCVGSHRGLLPFAPALLQCKASSGHARGSFVIVDERLRVFPWQYPERRHLKYSIPGHPPPIVIEDIDVSCIDLSVFDASQQEALHARVNKILAHMDCDNTTASCGNFRLDSHVPESEFFRVFNAEVTSSDPVLSVSVHKGNTTITSILPSVAVNLDEFTFQYLADHTLCSAFMPFLSTSLAIAPPSALAMELSAGTLCNTAPACLTCDVDVVCTVRQAVVSAPHSDRAGSNWSRLKQHYGYQPWMDWLGLWVERASFRVAGPQGRPSSWNIMRGLAGGILRGIVSLAVRKLCFIIYLFFCT
jgi:hypothetical protein